MSILREEALALNIKYQKFHEPYKFAYDQRLQSFKNIESHLPLGWNRNKFCLQYNMVY
jgi:hypothetical protein